MRIAMPNNGQMTDYPGHEWRNPISSNAVFVLSDTLDFMRDQTGTRGVGGSKEIYDASTPAYVHIKVAPTMCFHFRKKKGGSFF